MQSLVQSQVPLRVKEHLLKKDPSVVVILFGSRARGDADAESDWDFMALHDKALTWQEENEYINWIFDLEMEIGEVISVRHWSKEQWNSDLYKAMPLHQNISREGIWL